MQMNFQRKLHVGGPIDKYKPRLVAKVNKRKT